MKKRILYVECNADGTIGGSYYSLLYLIEQLDKSRYEPIVVFYQNHPLLRDFQRHAHEVLVMPPPADLDFMKGLADGKYNLLLRRLLFPFVICQKACNFVNKMLIPAMKSARWLRSKRIELVHLSNSLLNGREWVLAAKITHTKCVVHHRGYGYKSALARNWARLVDGIICVSNDVKNDLQNDGISKKNGRLVTIYNGIDVVAFSAKRTKEPAQVRREFDIPITEPFIGMPGNIKHRKGQHVVIEAAALLVKKYPQLKCLIIGPVSNNEADVAYCSGLKDLVEKKGLERNIVFTGYRSDIPDILNALDILIQSQVGREPFGRVFLEGMALHKPIIASDLGGNRESVEHGKSGLLVQPGDPDALAEAINRLLQDRELSNSLGEMAQRRVREKFTAVEMARKVEAFYETILVS